MYKVLSIKNQLITTIMEDLRNVGNLTSLHEMKVIQYEDKFKNTFHIFFLFIFALSS